MLKTRLSLALGTLIGASGLVHSSAARADLPLTLTAGVTTDGPPVSDLHTLALWACAAAALAVFSMLLYSTVRHRRAQGAGAAQFHKSTAVEMLWTSIPFAILVTVAVPATRALVAVEADRTVVTGGGGGLISGMSDRVESPALAGLD